MGKNGDFSSAVFTGVVGREFVFVNGDALPPLLRRVRVNSSQRETESDPDGLRLFSLGLHPFRGTFLAEKFEWLGKEDFVVRENMCEIR